MASSLRTGISFFFPEPVTLRNRLALKKFIQAALKKRNIRLLQLKIIFCDDRELLRINQQFLQHDFYTDIITFQLSEKKEPLDAEIYISVDRVKDNARTRRLPLYQELHRVIFHGLLHLCGEGDKTPSQKRSMSRNEDLLLNKYSKLRST